MITVTMPIEEYERLKKIETFANYVNGLPFDHMLMNTEHRWYVIHAPKGYLIDGVNIGCGGDTPQEALIAALAVKP